MYSEIIDQIKAHLEEKINVMPVQVGYYGDFNEIDFRRPAVLLEPRRDTRAAKSTRWKDGSYNLRIWIMNEITRDYLSSMRDLERLIYQEDDQMDDVEGDGILDSAEFFGVAAALESLKKDAAFTSMTGKVGGKAWRINTARILDIGGVDFGINQTASARINTAQMDLTIFIEVEK
jgi:hypothetical protein